MEVYDEIGSIDEAAEVYKNTLYQNRIVTGQMAHPTRNQEHTITAQQEFWGHCSNIQAWIENDYDTRILYRNMAFPLLKELMHAGDPKAKKVFKEEIAVRLESGYPNVVNFLVNEGYLGYFENEELGVVFENSKILENAFKDRNLFYTLQPFLQKIPNISKKLISYLKDDNNHNLPFRELLRSGYLNLLDLKDWDLIFDNQKYMNVILKELSLLTSYLIRNYQILKKIVLYTIKNAQSEVSRIIQQLKTREWYNLSIVLKEITKDFENKLLTPKVSKYIESHFDELFLPNLQQKDIASLLENPKSILHKRYIKFNQQILLIKNNVLDLSDQEIIDLRDIKHLSSHPNIKKLILDNNEISTILGLKGLTKLEELCLRNNKITEIKGLSSLVNLKILRLEDNKICEMKGLSTLANLTELSLEGNNVTQIKGLRRLKKLRSLNLSRNEILKIEEVEHLKELESLDLAFNKIIEVNYSKLPSANTIYLESNPIIKIIHQKNENHNNNKRIISYPVNQYITVESEGNTIQIYVNNQLGAFLIMNKEEISVYEGFTNKKSKSSYYVRYISKGKGTKKYPGFGTIEVAGEVDHDQRKSIISVDKLYPLNFNEEKEEDKDIVTHTKFMQFCMRLQVWNDYNYEPRLLQKNIAIPLLKKLGRLGDKVAQRVLKGELNKKKIVTLQNIRNGIDYVDEYDDDKYGIA